MELMGLALGPALDLQMSGITEKTLKVKRIC